MSPFFYFIYLLLKTFYFLFVVFSLILEDFYNHFISKQF